MNSSESIEGVLTTFFQEAEFPVLFAGAGVSMLAKLPDWRNILTRMAEAVRPHDPLSATQMLNAISKGAFTKAADYFWLVDDMRDGDKSDTLKQILNAYDHTPLLPLASLPFQGVVTTNFVPCNY